MQMICAWKELLGILPLWMRSDVDSIGKETLQELRLRINSPPELILTSKVQVLSRNICTGDLNYCVNAASKYSPWAAATISKGYITAPGGHRIGLCGSAVFHSGVLSGIRDLQSLCIRVARDFSGIAENVRNTAGSVLILGAPGWGKTTLLRDLCRKISREKLLCVMDERGELFPDGIPRGKRMDVLSGCPKTMGIEILLRTMGPEYIGLDEITAAEDCEALIRAANCGVNLIATAHAASLKDYISRKVYASLIQQNIFRDIVLLHPDKTYTLERITT